MSKELSEMFNEVAEHAELVPRSYSGRGMYGDRCVGIDRTTDGQDIHVGECMQRMMYSIMQMLDDEYVSSEDYDPFQNRSPKAKLLWDLADKMGKVSWDSMGLGQITYWPRIEFIDTEEYDDEECDHSDDPENERLGA